MPNEAKKGITVKVDAGLHAEVKQYIESHGITMAEFVSLALHDELHPKFQTKEDAGNMRTLAFQVPEDLFQKIKDYLHRNNMTQKEFIIGLISQELIDHLIVEGGVEYIQVHPTFLYESVWNLGVLLFMLWYRKRKKFDGQMLCIYLLGYGLGRTWIEGLRTDQLKFFATGIPVSQALSMVLVLGAVLSLVMGSRKIGMQKEDDNGETYQG